MAAEILAAYGTRCDLKAVGTGTLASMLLTLDLGIVGANTTDSMLLTLDVGIPKPRSVTAG